MKRPFVVVAVLAAVAGCSSTEAGTPVESVARPAAPIPEVQDPRDITGIAPCDLLTANQLASLAFDQPGEVQKFEEISGVPGCVWQDAARTREVSVGVLIDVDALSNLYLQRESYAVFELIDVAGHPAVLTQNIAGGTRCSLVVGAAERQSLDVDFTTIGTGTALPCPEAERVAEVILGNLSPAS